MAAASSSGCVTRRGPLEGAAEAGAAAADADGNAWFADDALDTVGCGVEAGALLSLLSLAETGRAKTFCLAFEESEGVCP